MERLTKSQALTYLRNPAVAAKLDKATKEAIIDGTASLKPVVLYIRKKIVFGSGTIKLIDSKTRETKGVSNIEQNRLPAFRNVVFHAALLGYATDAADAKEAQLNYNTTLPVSLRNAELSINQDNGPIVTVPCSEFSADNAAVSELDKYVTLGGEYLIREQKAFEINIDFPEDTIASGGAGHDYVEVRLIGIQTTESKN